MGKFVSVRMVKGNGLNLEQFQFDFDLTFAILFMNAAGDVYGRFGTRSSHDQPTRDISLMGLRAAMQGALGLHANLPLYKASLRAKQGPPPRHGTPEEYPSLSRFKKELDYEGQVARSCIHCHQIRDAERAVWREDKKPLPEQLLFPWPMPDVIGLSLDRDQRATVQAVSEGSPAKEAGFQPRDELLRLNGQPLLSIADVQWVLHHLDKGQRLDADVRRDGQTLRLTIDLPADWRRQSDISWRTTTWDLRRMVSGGLVLEELSPEKRREFNLADDSLALLVKHVGQYGPHAVAKKAGFQKGDVVIQVDDRRQSMRETDFLAYALEHTTPGQVLRVTVLRGGERHTLRLPMQ